MSLAITRSAYACRRALATVLVFAGCQRDRALPTVPPDQLGDQRTTTVNVAPLALFTVSPRWPRPGDTVTVDASSPTSGAWVMAPRRSPALVPAPCFPAPEATR